MAVNSGNVDVVTSHDLKDIPECEHGNRIKVDNRFLENSNFEYIGLL